MNRKERRAAGKLVPQEAEARRLNEAAADCHRRGDLGGVVAACRRLVRLDPGRADAHFNLAVALNQAGEVDEAAACYLRVTALRPGDASAWANLGNLQGLRRNFVEAVECYRRAIAIRGDWAAVHVALGMALTALERSSEAADAFGRAAEIAPDDGEVHWLLGVALFESGRTEAAITAFGRSAALDSSAAAYSSLAHALKEFGDVDGALAACAQSLAIDPEFAEAHYNRGIIHLLAGDYCRGWPDYDYRWRIAGAASRSFPQPAWGGEPLAGRTIFLYGEQGLGDVLNFVRFVPEVAARGGKVVVEVQETLVPLVSSIAGAERVIGADSAPPPFDVHLPLLSVPAVLGLALDSLPATVPYLAVADGLVARWRGVLPKAGFRVGIVWQGNPRAKADLGRSIPLAEFAPLGRIPGITLVRLQRNHGLEQMTGSPEVLSLPGYDSGGFEDTAAVMSGLDLVITSDTSVAHLAGALGLPVWIVLKRVPDWRWGLEGETSPWYPSARLFRQREAGNWGEVFGRIAEALEKREIRPR